ncbi:chromosome partitioning protein, ParB family, partial [Granulicatella balaenopterae]
PFTEYTEKQLEILMMDIKKRGLDNAIIVRPKKDYYEIVAGHNRYEAIKRLGWTTIPAIIKDLTDEETAIGLVQSNFMQRQHIKESEKARAYKLKVDATKHQGKKGTDSLKIIAVEEKISERTLSRYVACAKLIDEFMNLLDNKKLSLANGEILAKFSDIEQLIIFNSIVNFDIKITSKNLQLIKTINPITEDAIKECFTSEDEDNEEELEKTNSKKTKKTVDDLMNEIANNEELSILEKQLDTVILKELLELLHSKKMIKL